jgi:four helix bundle protein
MVVHPLAGGAMLCASEAEGILRDFKGLLVWKKAHALALNVYRVTRTDPGRDHAGLVGQSRRAAISVAANIAEGCGRETQRDFVKFLNIAFASATELEYHMILTRDLGVIGRAEFRGLNEQIEEVCRMLTGLIQRVRAAQSPAPPPNRQARNSQLGS